MDYVALSVILRYLNPTTVLEIGTGAGYDLATMVDHTSNDCQITTLDIIEHRGVDFLKIYGNVRRVDMLLKHSVDFQPTGKYDFINLDGSHSYEDTKREVRKFIPHLSESGILMIDDYPWESVTKVIQEMFDEHTTDSGYHGIVPFLLGLNCAFFCRGTLDICDLLDNALRKYDMIFEFRDIKYLGEDIRMLVPRHPGIIDHESIFREIVEKYEL